MCDILEGEDRVTEVIECFRHMQNEPMMDLNPNAERAEWKLDFGRRCVEKLEKLGDTAMGSKYYPMAIEHYTKALSLDPMNTIDILIKRSRARAGVGSLEDALIDATKVIELEPCYRGYERKYAALHGMGHHREAFKAFQTMLSILHQSTDPHIQELYRTYVDATSLIRGAIEQTIRDIPRVLIDIATCRLLDKRHQAAAFEELPIYDELRSSMTTHDQLDNPRIQREVKMFFQYVMLSHKWEPDEPTFQMLENGSVYELPTSRTNNKLLRFCELVRSLQFRWAWSDTCCVNQADKGVQQESVIAMFRWYRGASLTVVHLLGVFSDSHESGCLWRSIWNTRGWTYQEYLASKVVQFYTEDWRPYLGLDTFNHKESTVVLSEMEHAMNLTTRALDTLQPGLERAREKLYLASGRKTTREEDIAYSLFGIFNVALPVIYGEGNQAVGRLLEHILTRSDNVSLLAWTGISSSHHSYFPTDLTVYDQIMPPHVPQPIETTKMNSMVKELRSILPDPSPMVALYERLHNLSSLSLVSGRLRLPGIIFPISDLVLPSEPDSHRNLPVYRATAYLLGDIRIQTRDNLSVMKGLLLIHPWITPLLDRDFAYDSPRFNLETRALHLTVWLKQPFGALLLASVGRVQYKRVATDSLIMAQVREETTLVELVDSIRTVDIQ